MFQLEERPISSIIIEERARKDLRDLTELKASIAKNGQLNPILITDKSVLIAGERRLAACKELGQEKVLVRIMPNLTQEDRLFIELTENKEREDFVWHEELDLKYKMHNHWKAQAKEKNSPWGYRDTAEKFHCALGGLSTDLALAEALQIFPELRECEGKTQAKATYKKLGEQAVAFQSLENLPEDEKEKLEKLMNGSVSLANIPAQNNQETFLNGIDEEKALHDDIEPFMSEPTKEVQEKEPPKAVYVIKKAEEFLSELPDNSVGLAELDPPYAINFSENYGAIGNRKATEADWTVETLYSFYEAQLPVLYKKLLESSWVLLWTGCEHWTIANDYASKAGFKVQTKPGIWIKPSGECNRPSCEFVNNYEMFLLLRKGNATFNTASFSATVEHQATHGSKKIHQWEKPITLYDHFITALGRQGSLFISPFAGSGNSMISATKYGMVAMGSDLRQKYAVNFYERFNKHFMDL